MSIEKNMIEAQRWLKTAQGDYHTATILLEHGRYAHSCFHAQQSGEKAMKAVWFILDADPWGHSIKKLLVGLEKISLEIFKKLNHLEKPATILDRFYIPTRYPNGLPDITPEEAYLQEDAISCLQNAKLILTTVTILVPDGC